MISKNTAILSWYIKKCYFYLSCIIIIHVQNVDCNSLTFLVVDTICCCSSNFARGLIAELLYIIYLPILLWYWRASLYFFFKISRSGRLSTKSSIIIIKMPTYFLEIIFLSYIRYRIWLGWPLLNNIHWYPFFLRATYF